MNRIKNYLRSLHRRNYLIAAAFFILIAIMIAHISGGGTESETATTTARSVTVASVASLANDATPVTLLGTVTSRSEAMLRAEASGRAAVYKKLGDRVSAGEAIVALENSAERAAVLQAEGAYEAALAGKNIAAINRGSSGLSLAEARESAQNALSSAYVALDDAVRTKTDPMFANPRQRDVRFIVQSADSRLVTKIEEERVAIESMLAARAERNRVLGTGSDFAEELGRALDEARTVAAYLDDLTLALTQGIASPTTPKDAIDGYKAAASGARSGVSGVQTALTGARNTLNGAIAASQVAEETSGAGSGTTASDAAVKSALGALESARARLAKMVVRSPISGTINSLRVETGDVVSSGMDIAVVSNNGALEVVANATEDDARQIAVGNKVAIGNGALGTVTRIAPALDPATKKIEIRVGILSGQAELLNGESVRIAIDRATKRAVHPSAASSALSIPLSALKITPQGSIVFMVDGDGTLIAHPVKEGRLQGEKVEITEGLTAEMEIVVDARGLKEGMSVLSKTLSQ